MDPRLKEAARTGNLDAFYSLTEEKPRVLMEIDTESFAETPLHVAASEGQIAFALEMMKLRPVFARTLNPAGFSPMHLALQNGKTQLVYRLVEMDKDLVRVKGREGKTPFHHAVEQENKEILDKFLEACPECIQDVTVQNDTALHIALNWDKFEIFKFLVRWIRYCRHKDAGGWEERVLNWKDEKGNTLLHIAAIRNNLEAVKLLSEDCMDVVDMRANNLENFTALQCISSKSNADCESNIETRSQVDTKSKIIRTLQMQGGDPKINLMHRFFWKQKKNQVHLVTRISRTRNKISHDMRNALLVVMTLIITATSQSALSPPGGVWQGDSSNSSSPVALARITPSTDGSLGRGEELHQPGTVIMQNNIYSILWSLNTLSLLITCGLIVFILPDGIITLLLLVPLSIFCSSFMLSMSILAPGPLWSKANKILSLAILTLPIIPFYIIPFIEYRKHPGSVQPKVQVFLIATCVLVGLSALVFYLAKLFPFYLPMQD